MLNKKLCVNNNIIPVNNVIPSEDNNIFVEKLKTIDNITIIYVFEINSTKSYIGLNSFLSLIPFTVFNNTKYSNMYNIIPPIIAGIVITISVNLINNVTTKIYDIRTSV